MRPMRKPWLKGFVCRPCRRRLSQSRASLPSATSSPEIYDVVTVGGGPVGLALVAALKSSSLTKDLKVALIESQPIAKISGWAPEPGEYSNRASSLTPSSVSFLESIGAWKHVEQSRVQPYDEMQVWDGANGSKIQFDWASEAEKYNSPRRTVATMTENPNLSKGLLSRVLDAESDEAEHNNSHRSSLMFNSTVLTIANGYDDPHGFNLSSWPVISVQSSDTEAPFSLAARLLVGADGINSPVRAFAGIPSRGWDYDRHGVVATLNIEGQQENDLESLFNPEVPQVTAYQRFLPALGGPIALLPLPHGKASLVWSTTPSIATYLKSLPLSTMATMVNAAFRLSMTDLSYLLTLPANPRPTQSPSSSTYSHAEELSWRLQHTFLPSHLPPRVLSIQPSTVASFPLRFRQSSTYASPRIALLGDAAHTIHPLAGQGLNLGIGDASALFQMIETAVLKGQDLGDMMTLERYNRQRWGQGAMVGGTCDLLHKVYGAQGSLMGWGRGLGMEVVESFPWLKGWFMGRAEGW